MGCGVSSFSCSNVENVVAKKPDPSFPAALLIQCWYRRCRARLEARRRCAWNIYQSLEYEGEQDQLKLYNFFNEMLTHLSPDAVATSQLAVAFNFATGSEKLDPLQTEPGLEVGSAEYKLLKLTDPELVYLEPDYSGPTLELPINQTQVKNLLEAFKNQQIEALAMQANIKNFFSKRGAESTDLTEPGSHRRSRRQDEDNSDEQITTCEEDVFLDDYSDSSRDSDLDGKNEPIVGAVGGLGTPKVAQTKQSLVAQPQLPPGPADISSGRTEGPLQPKDLSFPSTRFGVKQRSFRSAWYTSYSWLEYSVSKDAAFCFCCRMFPVPNKPLTENVFTSVGYQQWKKANEKDAGFAQHERSDYYHLTFFAWKELQEHVSKGRTVDVALISAHERNLLNIALVLPPTSASCEHSFSSMPHIKSYLRSTMSDSKLSSLGVIGIHTQRAKQINMNNFINIFAGKHNNKNFQLF